MVTLDTLNTQTIQQPVIFPTTISLPIIQQQYTIIHNATPMYHNLKLYNNT